MGTVLSEFVNSVARCYRKATLLPRGGTRRPAWDAGVFVRASRIVRRIADVVTEECFEIARANLSECVREVKSGGTVVVTEHGRPVARMNFSSRIPIRRSAFEMYDKPNCGDTTAAGAGPDAEQRHDRRLNEYSFPLQPLNNRPVVESK
jgi:antitoxin (DNA-binding transcriptional repressor) of toxin-antitoxin stability system